MARSDRSIALPIAVLVSLLGVGVGTRAHAEPISFSLRPEVGVQLGSEQFEFIATLPGSASPVIQVNSRLTYPRSTTLVGATASVGTGALTYVGSFHTNVHDPWGRMVDQDFAIATWPTGSQSVEFSHTDSRTQMRAWSAEGSVRLRVAELGAEPGTAKLQLVSGFRYESNTYDIYGLSGWQLDENANHVAVSLPDDTHVLQYRSRYSLPFVGARFDALLGERVSLGTEARFIVAWSTHDDDHLLRHKSLHSSPHGVGFSVAAEPMIDLGGSSARVFVGLDLRLQYVVSIGGTLTQHYYGDDPFLPGDQTNLPIPNSDFWYKSLQARFLAFLRLNF